MAAIVCVDIHKERAADHYRAKLARYSARSRVSVEIRSVY